MSDPAPEDLRLRQAAERLRRAEEELAAAEREHTEAAWIVDALAFLAQQFPEQRSTSDANQT